MGLTHLNSYYFSNRLHEVLVRKLAATGLEQHVFVPVERKSGARSEPTVDGVSFCVDPCFSALERRLWPLKMRQVRRAYERDRKAFPAEIHHAHTLIVNGLVAYRAKRRYGIPYAVTVRNTDSNFFLSRHRFFRWLGGKVADAADALITLSPAYWREHLPRHFPPERIARWSAKHHLIPNGCDDFWFEHVPPPRVRGETLEILFVGRLDRNKNLVGLLEAVRQLVAGGVRLHLTVVGDGPLAADLRGMAAGLPVKFAGFVGEKNELREYYQRADVLAVPSFTESFGIVYAEALTQGVPVIYTAGQGFDGFFESGTVGHAVDPRDPADITTALQRIGAEHAEYASRARANAERFRWDASVGALVRVYERMAERRTV